MELGTPIKCMGTASKCGLMDPPTKDNIDLERLGVREFTLRQEPPYMMASGSMTSLLASARRSGQTALFSKGTLRTARKTDEVIISGQTVRSTKVNGKTGI